MIKRERKKGNINQDSIRKEKTNRALKRGHVPSGQTDRKGP